jgi:hypothetical protein
MIVFTDFLKDNGVDVQLFMKNCLPEYTGFITHEGRYPRIKITYPKGWIKDAFLWNTSLQPRIDWPELNVKWRDTIRNVLIDEIAFTQSRSPKW